MIPRIALFALVFVAGCGGTAEVTIPPGAERGACLADGSCNAGLSCLSGYCVAWQADNNAATMDMGTASGADMGSNQVPDLNSLDLGQADAPPAAPTDLTATIAGAAVSLSWSDNSDDEGGFVLERRDDVVDPDFVDLELLAADSTSYSDTSVYKGVTYTYRIRAVNNAGSSANSNEASATTPAPTLQADIVPVLDRTCGSGDVACHFRNQYAATADRDCRGWLSLENAAIGSFVYDADGNNMQSTGCQDRDLRYRLTQIRAWQCGGNFVTGDANYVVPGDLANSYVWQKMEGTRLCDVGDQPSERMPQTGQIDARDRMLIRQWIVTGALP